MTAPKLTEAQRLCLERFVKNGALYSSSDAADPIHHPSLISCQEAGLVSRWLHTERGTTWPYVCHITDAGRAALRGES